MTKQETRERIEECKKELSGVLNDIANFELDPDKFEEQYRDFLDDCYGEIDVCGMKFQASRALEELDPTAFRCGLLDYVDGMDINDDIEYQELKDMKNDLEDELYDLING